MEQPIRVLVVDDHPVYRRGLVTMLRERHSNIDVIGEARDGSEAVGLVADLNPHVVLMDIKMPVMDGIEATRRIKGLFPRVKVLALSAYDDDGYVTEMVKAGASGYMLKEADHATIVSSVEAVHEGKTQLHPRLATKVFGAFDLPAEEDRQKDDYDGLTERELEVLRLVACGMTTRQVAIRLWVSEHTVENHLHSIYRKLGISDRIGATLYAIRKGIITLEERGTTDTGAEGIGDKRRLTVDRPDVVLPGAE